MRLTKPSSNITTTKKKYRESIGRSKEFITWLERSYFRERQNKRLRSSRSQMFFKIGVLYIFYIMFLYFFTFLYIYIYILNILPDFEQIMELSETDRMMYFHEFKQNDHDMTLSILHI